MDDIRPPRNRPIGNLLIFLGFVIYLAFIIFLNRTPEPIWQMGFKEVSIEIAYSEKAKSIFVSQTYTKPSNYNFISKISYDGKSLIKNWSVGYNEILDIAVAGDEVIVTDGQGLYFLDSNSAARKKYVRFKPHIKNGFIAQIIVDNDNSVYLADLDNFWYKYQNDKIVYLGQIIEYGAIAPITKYRDGFLFGNTKRNNDRFILKDFSTKPRVEKFKVIDFSHHQKIIGKIGKNRTICLIFDSGDLHRNFNDEFAFKLPIRLFSGFVDNRAIDTGSVIIVSDESLLRPTNISRLKAYKRPRFCDR
ncbi:MAG: hypothetical protein FD163_209 [Hyphomonadaceae bacterium]|nr:MAG: hypothetical protein FD163_209 [Hyphomonadaceae bacterium]